MGFLGTASHIESHIEVQDSSMGFIRPQDL